MCWVQPSTAYLRGARNAPSVWVQALSTAVGGREPSDGCDGGNITFSVAGAVISTSAAYQICGGGGRGGDGGDGLFCLSFFGAPAPEGLGGLAGAAGVLSVTGASPVTCSTPDLGCGLQVFDGTVFRGEAGTPGGSGGCDCAGV